MKPLRSWKDVVFTGAKIKKIFPLLFALLLISVVWRGILSMTIQGEGFLYFSEDTYVFDLDKPFKLANYYPFREDFSAIIINHLLSRIFFDNMLGYFAVLFSVMLLVISLMYKVIRTLTGSSLAAFCSVLVFGLSYAANANMLASGGYQYFTQRVVVIIPLFISFLFLYKYLKRRLLQDFLFSLLIYLLTIFLSFYSTDFLPVMILYPLIFLAFNIRQGWIFFIKTIWVPLPFMIGNFLIIKKAGALVHNTPDGTSFLITFFKIMADLQSNIPDFLQQLAVLTLPFFWDPSIFGLIKNIYGINITSDTQLVWAQSLSVVIYIGALIFLWKIKPAWRIFTVFSLATFLALVYLNLYLNAEQSLNTFYASRYFYYPFLMGAFFWGLFFSGIFLKKRGIFRKVFIIFFSLWIGYNVFSVERMFREEGWRHKANREMLAKVKELSPVLKERPYYIYFPGSLNTLGPGGLWFARGYYAHPKTYIDFEQPDILQLEKQNIQPEDIFVFNFSHQTHKVTDETGRWRAELRKLNYEQY